MPLTLMVQTSIGKRYVIYIPKAIVRALNLKEGGKVILRVSGTSLVLESVQDPIHLAISGKKFASITPEEVERISLREQGKNVKSSS